MKYLSVAIALIITAGTVHARPARTLLVADDQLPYADEIEMGLEVAISELDEGGDGRIIRPYVRYGLFEKLSVSLKVPAVLNSSDEFGNAEGIGDIALGLSILAYGPAEIGDYSFVFNLGATLPTGDEDDGLGAGEGTYSAGVVFAMRLTEDLIGILDGRYIGGSADADAVVAGFAIIEQVTRDFSVNLEVFNRMNDPGGEDDWNTTVTVGISVGSLADMDDLSMMVSAGANITDESSAVIGARVAYQY